MPSPEHVRIEGEKCFYSRLLAFRLFCTASSVQISRELKFFNTANINSANAKHLHGVLVPEG